MRDWEARVREQFSVGGHVAGGSMEPAGTVHLNGVMAESGIHDGREVRVSIAPEVLETVAAIVADAIASRDRARARVVSGESPTVPHA